MNNNTNLFLDILLAPASAFAWSAFFLPFLLNAQIFYYSQDVNSSRFRWNYIAEAMAALTYSVFNRKEKWAIETHPEFNMASIGGREAEL